MNKIVAIAINKYWDTNISNMNNCENDINSLIEVLTSRYNFSDVEILSRPEQTTLSFIHNKLNEIFINSFKEDNVLLLFAGHGDYNEILDTNYWICSDSKKSDVTTWFNVDYLLKFFKASPAKHIALISDSCFSGAIFELNRGGTINALTSKKSREAITSGGIEQVSDGVKNSPFNKTLVEIFYENESEELTFQSLSEKTIIKFDSKYKQTPAHGALSKTGHEGGTFVFSLKEEISSFVRTIQLIPGICESVKIDGSINVPFFNMNKYFDHLFVNSFVQQLGYSIVNDIRQLFYNDVEFCICRSNDRVFYIDAEYTIHTLNEKYLSITIARDDYFWGPYPNHYIYSINFALKPVRTISLYDLVDYSDFSNLYDFLLSMIDLYADCDRKDILKSYTDYTSINELGFSFDEKVFTIYYVNLMAHAFKGAGVLEIPIDKIRFK